MVLAAGLGQRMLPLTLAVPKPSIPLLGRPIALQILKRIADAGFERAVVNLHHHPEIVREQLERGATGDRLAIEFTHEDEILGTAGGLRNAGSLLRGAGPILVHNSDFVSDIDFGALVEAHRESGRLATLVLAAPRPGYSVVEVGDSGQVISIAGRPAVSADQVHGRQMFTGCHVIDEAVLDRIPGPGPSCIINDVYRPLAAEGRLGAFVHEGFWWEFGTPELYLAGSMRLLELPADRLGRLVDHDPIRSPGAGQIAVGDGAAVHDGAEIVGCNAIARGCLLEKNARLEECVTMTDSRIGAGCRLRQTIIGPGVTLPAGFEAESVLICDDPDPGWAPTARTRREGRLLIYSFDERRTGLAAGR